MQTMVLNQAQREVLNVMSCLGKDDDLSELKKLLVSFLNERLQRELDILWDNGALDEKNLKLFVMSIYEHLIFKLFYGYCS